MPVVEFNNVQNCDWPVVHNVCASLSRVAKSMGWTVSELESRLSEAYDNLIPATIVSDPPVRQNVETAGAVDLGILPGIRYTESETHPYISAAHVVAKDPASESLNISFHRLMITGRNTLSIYMTAGGHLDQIFNSNVEKGKDTPVAVFIGAHPLWSLGALASGSLALDEFSTIGGVLGYPLPVTQGLQDQQLKVPACAELVLEGYLSQDKTAQEGPYGEAFGYVSAAKQRPVLTVQSLSYRNDPIFQDIVPAQLEHLTLTGTALQVHLTKSLMQQYACVSRIHLPAPMTVYVAIKETKAMVTNRQILQTLLTQQKFIKHAVLFSDDVDLSNSKQTQTAIALHVQAHRDLVVVSDQPGNGLDPSEIDGHTNKWGIDACSAGKHSPTPGINKLPDNIAESIDLKAILKPG